MISQRRAQQRPATPLVSCTKNVWGESGRPGSVAFPEENRKNGV